MSNEEKILSMLSEMRSDIQEIKSDVAGLNTEVAELKADVAMLKTDMADMKVRVKRLEGDMAQMRSDMDELREAQEETRDGVNVLLEWAEACGNVIKFPPAADQVNCIDEPPGVCRAFFAAFFEKKRFCCTRTYNFRHCAR